MKEEHLIVAGAENCPPILEKSMYDSWASRIRLFIKGKKHGRMLLDSIDNGPLTEDLDAYDSNCDDISSAKAVLMENISSYDPDVLSKEIDTLKETLSTHVKENDSLAKTLTGFKTESKEKESKYTDKENVLEKQNKELEISFLGIDNDQLLKQIMSQEIVHVAVNYVDSLDVEKSCVIDCNKFVELETELLKKNDLIEKDVYDKLLKSYSTLKKHCISLELTKLIQEIFQKDNFCKNQNVPTFNQLFKINELKAQTQAKNMVIRKLKDRIKSLSGKDSVENIKKDIDEIKMINSEVEHSVAKITFKK
nr:hypothetical protein [Tanacetum cinerariifolium]